MQKNLFIVHSSITLRMARAVVQYEQLAMEDCIFLLDRGYRIDQSAARTYDISDLSLSVFRWQGREKLWQTFQTNRRHHAELRRLLEQEVGASYQLYLPHSWSYTYLALILHPLCKRYFFIEEGTLTYNPDLSIYDHHPALLRHAALKALLTACLGPQFPVFPQPLQFDHPKYDGCYGISEQSFPTLPAAGKHVLPPPFEHHPAYEDIQHILIPGPWIELNYCTVEQYRTLKTALFQYFVDQGIRTLHVKFHPLQYHRQESMPVFYEIAGQFADRIELVELPADTSPEEIAFSSSADFYLAYSSVTIYASQFGCRVLSYARPMYAHWPAFRRVFDNLPAVVTENMSFLDLELS
ncbi:hypothetical protein [Flavilitoribacter nigricans]|uniref:Uncharacterized protein n=1 Tax=Flavilitoribacter nigricans (strain ATCC 23147 / DSM 23189 / NBRC 102662 / NCIMB 1420 / SS-2) TaxID=1122177 RepID=A0A2D0NGD1_FLAN2|nr:hypothetical protein [Flavilitoribacter nigricans]PHN07564.1 hypothetical protein CRP01_05540 [Flavilitoribacter nigricans DSM 23189 = NBRC 102662]